MPEYNILFEPFNKTVRVAEGATLLDAAGMAHITIDSACGGDGICGRCKMIVRQGRVAGASTALLSRDEIRKGVVLACQTRVESDLVVEIPEATRAKEKVVIDRDAQRFRAATPGVQPGAFGESPIVSRIALDLPSPSLDNNLADCQRLQSCIERQCGVVTMQAGLKVIHKMPQILRESGFKVTAVLGHRRGVAEIMDLEAGDTSARNCLVVVDVGTSTIVAHLVDAVAMETVDAEACFNSQATYGREVTARMIAAEKRGCEALQAVLVEDINGLIAALARKNRVNLRDITAVVCAGNTAMMHFLLGLPTRNIRRAPFIAVTVEPPPFRAAQVGLKINPRGLLFTVPGIGAWVGGDIVAGILATGLYDMDGVGLFIDVGTNGEIVIGNREWLMACSASAGPALEGAGVACGMMAQEGAIEKVRVTNGMMAYDVIGGGPPDGLCGSGIIDLLAVLLAEGIIDRTGRIIAAGHPRVRVEEGVSRFVLVPREKTLRGRDILISQEDIENVITAKAAIFAATRILLKRLDLDVSRVDRVFIAGGFGGYINLRNAVAIGLFPDLPPERMVYVGNTSIWGAQLAALSEEARDLMRGIAARTTVYDLMGTGDYVEQFRQALFLPHTDIELFPSQTARTAT